MDLLIGVHLSVYCFAKQLYLKYSEAHSWLQTARQRDPMCFSPPFLNPRNWTTQLSLQLHVFHKYFSEFIALRLVFNLEIIKNLISFGVRVVSLSLSIFLTRGDQSSALGILGAASLS